MRFEDGAVWHGPEPKWTTHHVMMIREIVQPGDRVLAEVFMPRVTSGGFDGKQEVVTVTVIQKYNHVAVTDRGTVSWVNILLHNAALLNRVSI